MLSPDKKLVYLALEATREGSASFVHVNEIANGLRARGWDVTLVQPAYARFKRSPPLPVRLLWLMALQVKMWLCWPFQCRGSVLYVRNHNLAFPTGLIARVFGVPIFHEINGPYDDVFITHAILRPFQSVLIWMQKQQFRWATGLCAVSPQLAEWARVQSGGRPVEWVPNGANTDLFHPDAQRPDGLPDRYVLFFGSLARWHGVTAMIAAASSAHWPAGVDLVVIGAGQESATVQDAARAHVHIHALGHVPHHRLAGYIAHAIAGLVPISNPGQRSETGLFPLKMFETLACAVPVIVTDFPGQADVVREHGCGIVIPAEDSEALARAVADLAHNPDHAASMGRRGLDLVQRDYRWPVLAQRTGAFIERQISAKTPG
ncbi:glycosyl transferase, group 1 [Micavibrio aeruginosavorus EPB]|uniref:Glycosyl transferase, group 1 n=2 Tax=Micavibrio aeruginosavorus TaxID=349221 RepID=M4VCM3_9BACT|nr:glycosyl transferase, group 1 [Micavibrio aeruginosavorus EPB]